MEDPPGDTSVDAAAAQLEVWRRLGSEGRLELALRLSDEVRQVALAGIRQRHPQYSDATAVCALCRSTWGDELVREVWADEPLVDP